MLFSLWGFFVGIVAALPNILSSALTSYTDCLGTAEALFGCFYYLALSSLLGLVSLFPSENLGFLGWEILSLSLLMLFSLKASKKLIS